ncbi:MAG: hypothetical protein AAB482_00975, partial [Patescibacteria group bacterium]
MKTFTQQEILDRYDKLPQAVRDAIFSDSNSDKMLSIGRKHGLLLNKIGVLAAETGYVMVGLTHPNEFVGRLAEIFQIAPMKAKEIAEDINEQVFKPIREHLSALHDMSDASTEPKKPESFAPAMQKKVEEKPSFVAPMIFPEKIPPTLSVGSGTLSVPTNSDMPTFRKMPLEPSGSWKPPQPITPVFDQMRKQASSPSSQNPAKQSQQAAQKPDPYHEQVGMDAPSAASTTPPPI